MRHASLASPRSAHRSSNTTCSRTAIARPPKATTAAFSRRAGIWRITTSCRARGRRRITAAVRRHLKRSGVPVESSKGEWGLGQHELNVRYAEALQMADRHVVFKQCLKEVAEQAGLSVTFMAKFAQDRAGSSCHIHLSLWQDGRNAFAGDYELRAGEVLGRLPLVSGRLDRARAGCDGVLRAHDQLRTSDSWTRRGRRHGWRGATTTARPVFASSAGTRASGSNAAFPERTAIRISRLPRRSRPGSMAFDNRIEPPECFTGDVYAARHLPRVAVHVEGRHRRVRGKRVRATDVRRRGGRALHAFLPDRRVVVPDGGHGLGAAAIFRTDLIRRYGDRCRNGSKARWRSSRAPAAASAGKRRSSSPRKARRSWSSIARTQAGRDTVESRRGGRRPRRLRARRRVPRGRLRSG